MCQRQLRWKRESTGVVDKKNLEEIAQIDTVSLVIELTLRCLLNFSLNLYLFLCGTVL